MFARNLLILQSTWEQDPSDWITIQHRIEREAPDIEVRIANNGSANSVTARWQVRRPSLVFSPIRLIDFVPRGGAVFWQGRTTTSIVFDWHFDTADRNAVSRRFV